MLARAPITSWPPPPSARVPHPLPDSEPATISIVPPLAITFAPTRALLFPGIDPRLSWKQPQLHAHATAGPGSHGSPRASQRPHAAPRATEPTQLGPGPIVDVPNLAPSRYPNWEAVRPGCHLVGTCRGPGTGSGHGIGSPSPSPPGHPIFNKPLLAYTIRPEPARRDEPSAGGEGPPQPPRCSPSGMRMGSNSPEQHHNLSESTRGEDTSLGLFFFI